MKLAGLTLLLMIGVLFSGCVTGPADKDTLCDIFTDPGFKVLGKRLKDKQWIGQTQEKGIRVCNWVRPTKT